MCKRRGKKEGLCQTDYGEERERSLCRWLASLRADWSKEHFRKRPVINDSRRMIERPLHTRLIHKCTHLFVKNQCNGVPLFGNICGYRLVFCASRSGSDRGGPGYCLGGLRFSRCGCDGGRNLSGLSRTIALGGISVDACRIDI